MSIGHLLQDFSNSDTAAGAHQTSDIDLVTFDQGYAAGWEDATKAINDQKSQNLNEVITRIRDIDVSLAQQRRAILDDVQSVFSDVFNHLLPTVSKLGFAPSLIEFAMQEVEKHPCPQVRISINATDYDACVESLSAVDDVKILLEQDETLAPCQAVLNFQGSEIEYSFQDVISDIESRIKNLMLRSKDQSNE